MLMIKQKVLKDDRIDQLSNTVPRRPMLTMTWKKYVRSFR